MLLNVNFSPANLLCVNLIVTPPRRTLKGRGNFFPTNSTHVWEVLSRLSYYFCYRENPPAQNGVTGAIFLDTNPTITRMVSRGLFPQAHVLQC